MTISDQFADWFSRCDGAKMRSTGRSGRLLLSEYYWRDADPAMEKLCLTSHRKRDVTAYYTLDNAKAYVLKRQKAEQAEIAADEARHAAQDKRDADELALAQSLTQYKVVRSCGLQVELPHLKDEDGDPTLLPVEIENGRLVVEVRVSYHKYGNLPLNEAVQILGRFAALQLRGELA